MKTHFGSALFIVFSALLTIGCDGDAGTTDDSTKIEVEGPKVELGDDPVDLDPSTDGDVDIDTPLQGDS